jgi:hypothetical protein
VRFFRSNQPYSFSWSVPVEGFEIGPAFEMDMASGKCASKSATFLLDRNPLGISKARTYAPLRERSGLFRTFANIDPKDNAGILAFANQHGPLAGDTSGLIGRSVLRRGIKRGETQSPHYGETIESWRRQIASMKWLARIWDAIQQRNHSFLRRLIHWHAEYVSAETNSGMRDYPWPNEQTMQKLATADDPVMWPMFQRGDLLEPAKLYLQREINKQLTAFPSQVRLLWENGGTFLFVSPKNLIAALWFQFAAAVDGDRKYCVCEQCRRWFQIGDRRDTDGDHRRSDSSFCSNACKQKAYRKPKKGKERTK